MTGVVKLATKLNVEPEFVPKSIDWLLYTCVDVCHAEADVR